VEFAGAQQSGNFNLSGFIGGQLGCNWQWGAWVFGIEGDGSATNKSGQAFGTGGHRWRHRCWTPHKPLTRPGIYELQERWLVTARGRLGWAIWDKTMVYVTGGGAWAKIDSSDWVTTSPQSTGT
jgi:outer membrane immunogenic protein